MDQSFDDGQLERLASHGVYRFDGYNGNLPGNDAKSVAGYLHIGRDGEVRVEFEGSIHRYHRPIAQVRLTVGATDAATVPIEMEVADEPSLRASFQMDPPIGRVLAGALAAQPAATNQPQASRDTAKVDADIFPTAPGPAVVRLQSSSQTKALQGSGLVCVILGFIAVLWATIDGGTSRRFATGLGPWLAVVGGIAGLYVMGLGVAFVVRASRSWVSADQSRVEISYPEGIRQVPRTAVQYFRIGRRSYTRSGSPAGALLICGGGATFPVPLVPRGQKRMQSIVDQLNAALGPPTPNFVADVPPPGSFALVPNIPSWRLALRARKWWSKVKRAALIGPPVLLLVSLPFWLVLQGLHDQSLSQPIAGGVATTGHVVRVVELTSRSTTVYRLTVRYMDQAGRPMRLSVISAFTTAPKEGTPVRLMYTRADPANVHDLTFSTGAWKFPFIAGIAIAAVEVVVVLPVTALARRSLRRRKERAMFSDFP